MQPFVDEVHPIQSLFLPRVYALLIPVVAGVIAMIGLGTESRIFVTVHRDTKYCSRCSKSVRLSICHMLRALYLN